MKRSIIVIVVLSLALLFVASCAPKQVQIPVSTGAAGTSPEEKQIDSGLNDLKELDTLGNTSEDVSFEDVDALGYGQ